MSAFISFSEPNRATSVNTKQQIFVFQVNRGATVKCLFTVYTLEFIFFMSYMNTEISQQTVLEPEFSTELSSTGCTDHTFKDA